MRCVLAGGDGSNSVPLGSWGWLMATGCGTGSCVCQFSLLPLSGHDGRCEREVEVAGNAVCEVRMNVPGVQKE